MMKIGLSSYSLSSAMADGRLDIFGAMDFAAENGAAGMEIVPGGNYVVNGNGEFADKIVRHARSAGLELIGYTVGANFVQPTPDAFQSEIARVKTEVDTAARLGVRHMRHDCGRRPPEEATCENFELDFPRFVDACGSIADYAKRFGITTSIENHGFHVQQSERVQRIVLAVAQDNFRTTLDVGNFLCVDEDPICAVMNNIRFAAMIHLKDFHIRRTEPPQSDNYLRTAHSRYIRGAVTGDGDIDLAAIVKIIVGANYRGNISIEYEGWEDCISSCRRAIRNIKNLFKQQNIEE